MAAVAAAPKAAIPATFSVPARRLNSCPPPRRRGSSPLNPSARTNAPTPLGPPILCADNGEKVGAQFRHIERYFAEGLDRIDVQETARCVNDLGRFRDRLDRAGFVIGQHDRHQRGRATAKQFPQMIEIDDARG